MGFPWNFLAKLWCHRTIELSHASSPRETMEKMENVPFVLNQVDKLGHACLNAQNHVYLRTSQCKKSLDGEKHSRSKGTKSQMKSHFSKGKIWMLNSSSDKQALQIQGTSFSMWVHLLSTYGVCPFGAYPEEGQPKVSNIHDNQYVGLFPVNISCSIWPRNYMQYTTLVLKLACGSF